MIAGISATTAIVSHSAEAGRSAVRRTWIFHDRTCACRQSAWKIQSYERSFDARECNPKNETTYANIRREDMPGNDILCKLGFYRVLRSSGLDLALPCLPVSRSATNRKAGTREVHCIDQAEKDIDDYYTQLSQLFVTMLLLGICLIRLNSNVVLPQPEAGYKVVQQKDRRIKGLASHEFQVDARLR